MRKIVITGLIFTITFFDCNSPKNENINQVADNEAAIKELLENYKKSINQIDTALAKSFWLTKPEVSFIHPIGHEKGWEGIKKGIYEMFGTRFSQRDLKSYDETITLYDDMAVLEFYWIFDGTFAGENPTTIQTRGRETQVLKKIDDAWRIVHIHYSSMPVIEERDGF